MRLRGARVASTGFLSKVSGKRETWERVALSCEHLNTAEPIQVAVRIQDAREGEMIVRKLTNAEIIAVIGIGSSKMQLGVKRITCGPEAIHVLEKRDD